MRTCIIVDDEYLAIKFLKKHLSERHDLLCVNSFTNPQEALDYLQENQIDIIFLDIEMPISGLRFKKIIPSECVLIFTSASPQYALEAFNQDAADYVLKPIVPERLDQAINKAIKILNSNAMPIDEIRQKQVVLTLKANKKIHKVAANDVFYIESLREYVCYHTKTEKLIALGALKDVHCGLPQDDFIRIHKSYIINKKFIANFNYCSVTLTNGKTFTIGRVHKQEFNAAITKMNLKNEVVN